MFLKVFSLDFFSKKNFSFFLTLTLLQIFQKIWPGNSLKVINSAFPKDFKNSGLVGWIFLEKSADQLEKLTLSIKALDNRKILEVFFQHYYDLDTMI